MNARSAPHVRLYAGQNNPSSELSARRPYGQRSVWQRPAALDVLSPAAQLLARALDGRDAGTWSWDTPDDLLRLRLTLVHRQSGYERRASVPSIWRTWQDAAARLGCSSVEAYDELIRRVYGDSEHDRLSRPAEQDVPMPFWDGFGRIEDRLEQIVTDWAAAGWVSLRARWHQHDETVRLSAA